MLNTGIQCCILYIYFLCNISKIVSLCVDVQHFLISLFNVLKSFKFSTRSSTWYLKDPVYNLLLGGTINQEFRFKILNSIPI